MWSVSKNENYMKLSEKLEKKFNECERINQGICSRILILFFGKIKKS